MRHDTCVAPTPTIFIAKSATQSAWTCATDVLQPVSAYTATSLAGLVIGWHHLAVTYDGRGGATAVDGITFCI